MGRRFWAVFRARNLEFVRDRSSMSWNLMFPFLILLGFAFIFDGEDKPRYKVGVLTEGASADTLPDSHPLKDLRFIEFVSYADVDVAKQKVSQHGVDLVIEPESRRYYVNEFSPSGYFVEQLLLGQTDTYTRIPADGREIRYLDWVLPGILGMNMMFSSLFGVGYVIVRYRKSAVLKRLQATPLSAFEFLLAQVSSRLFIVLFTSVIIFVVCDWMFDFYMLGSYLTLLLIAILGALSMISLGLLVASRSGSEELTGGMLNLISWPMMILSGVWFSLEGAPDFIRLMAQFLPLTHVVDAARAVMTEGADLVSLQYNIGVLIVMTILFLGLGAGLFKWQGDAR